MAGTLLASKEQKKRDKYSAACTAHGINLRPFAMETSGHIGASAYNCVKQIVTKGLEFERDDTTLAVDHQIKHFIQRLSCTMFSQNACMILRCAGKFKSVSGWREDPFAPLV